MSKRTAHNAAALAALFALTAIMGKDYARIEYRNRDASAKRGRSRIKGRNPGAFGGEKRAGTKLARKMFRNALSARRAIRRPA